MSEFISPLSGLSTSNTSKPVAHATGYNLPSLSGLKTRNVKKRQRGFFQAKMNIPSRLADASGFKVSAIGLTPCRSPSERR